MAARDNAWNLFGSSEGWKKLGSDPAYRKHRVSGGDHLPAPDGLLADLSSAIVLNSAASSVPLAQIIDHSLPVWHYTQ